MKAIDPASRELPPLHPIAGTQRCRCTRGGTGSTASRGRPRRRKPKTCQCPRGRRTAVSLRVHNGAYARATPCICLSWHAAFAPRGREDDHQHKHSSSLEVFALVPNNGELYNTIPASSSSCSLHCVCADEPPRAGLTHVHAVHAIRRVLPTGRHGEIGGRSSIGSLEYDNGLVTSL